MKSEGMEDNFPFGGRPPHLMQEFNVNEGLDQLRLFEFHDWLTRLSSRGSCGWKQVSQINQTNCQFVMIAMRSHK